MASIRDAITISIILLCNLTVFQKGTYYFEIKVFNNLPSSIRVVQAKHRHMQQQCQ
jgi:hypothetical protein